MLIPKESTIHGGSERYDKTVYSKMYVRLKVSRRCVLTAKCPHGQMSLQRSARTAMCLYGEISYGGMSGQAQNALQL